MALSLLLIAIIVLLPMGHAVGANSEFYVTSVSPSENSTIRSSTPTIVVYFHSDSGIDRNSVKLIVNGTDVSQWEETKIGISNISYTVPNVLSLSNGINNVTFEASDLAGNKVTMQWQFTVNPNANNGGGGVVIDVVQIVTYIVIGAAILGLGFGAYLLYLNRTKGFNFEKYFARKPLQKHYLIIYVPLIIAFIFVILAILLVGNGAIDSPYAYELIFVAAFFISATVYAVDAQLEKRRKGRFETAFAQFLFELADAIRGGIDPAKAVIEFAGFNNSVLKKRLKIAAEGIQMGRPFEEMMEVMVAPIKSDLIHRYASLIGEAAKTGGDISIVLHRAAKDMDDLIKIDYERRRQLSMQASTIYISFVVLIVIVWQLIGIYPTIGNGINISLLGQTSLNSANHAAGVSHMSFVTVKQRYFELIAVNSITAGLLIGAFTEGKIKFGLMHALIMVAASTVFFLIFIF